MNSSALSSSFSSPQRTVKRSSSSAALRRTSCHAPSASPWDAQWICHVAPGRAVSRCATVACRCAVSQIVTSPSLRAQHSRCSDQQTSPQLVSSSGEVDVAHTAAGPSREMRKSSISCSSQRCLEASKGSAKQLLKPRCRYCASVWKPQ